jgi:hypothetical protein
VAEFKGRKQKQMREEDAQIAKDGFNSFGKFVPYSRREVALRHCRDMGLTDTGKASGTIDRMAEAIARDEPYQAMEAGMAHLDITGTYRLLAVLCTDPPEATNG